MSPTSRLQLIHVFNHIMLIIFAFYGDWRLLGFSCLIWCVIGSLGISGGFHRLLAHKSFQCPTWFEKMCVYIGCMATFGSPITWAGAHRLHHSCPDQPGDPHSPHIIGFWRSYLHIWSLDQIPKRFIPDLMRKKYLLFIHRNYFKLVMVWAALAYCLGWQWGVAIYSAPAVIGFHATGLVDAMCHLRGYQNYDNNDHSKNNWFVNLVAFGEGFHNNHHHRPNHYRLGIKWWEIDMTAFLIELFGFSKKSKKSV